MTYTVSLTYEAIEDLQRLESFLIDMALERGDLDLPVRALAAIRREFGILESNPFTCRIAADDRLERELVIPFGAAGYVALFHIVSDREVVVSAIRHQREDDYH
ncbi:type II toxin-antitoxin system RelE/ParE family toxin [Variovorax sp. YR216]|uniref:type II toxin-antitoxin system RelE/ParE family toxin n=1 Tax=Variovorax sp. YR216 TaxID=1882828 RepID=UPI000896D7ED|nr:type II toxin-antitoxin system RelE/ParE family toxin [Variovorax sp. YR216]SEB22612.1 ParE toxin of type II toxin-antitoxin system, parDE [Variovorax sp. YR216]